MVVLLDTNIIIDHLRRRHSKQSLLMQIASKISKQNLALSVISIQELYEGKSTQNKEKESYLLSTIGPLKILPYDYIIAQLAGEIARDIKRPIELADAAIAATAIENNAALATLNKKDFQGIKGLELYQ